MKPETAAFLDKAREFLANAEDMLPTAGRTRLPEQPILRDCMRHTG